MPVSPSGEPLLVPTDAGPALRWGGIEFYPGTDPAAYARRKARVFSALPRSLYFVPSVGLGYGLSDLLERLPADSAVLCVEAFQPVMALALPRELPRDPRLLVVRADEPDGAVAGLRRLGTGRFRRVVEAPLSAGYRLAPETYARMRAAVEREIVRHWQNRLTLIALGSLQVRNALSNLALLPRALDFSALSTTLPVVVAGAGPSLESTLPSLLRVRQSCLLIAVDTALGTLRAAGLVPDLIVAVEAQAANSQDFIPASFPADTPWLACDLSVHPSVARLFAGRSCFFSSEFAPLRLWDRLQHHGLRPAAFPALGSVGVTAAHAALRLTAGSVFLTGLDFSYPQARTHASGSPSSVAMLCRADRIHPPGQAAFEALAVRPVLRSRDKHGRPILTDRVMSSYRDGLEAEAASSRERVFDCGSTGLPLGVRLITAEELEVRLTAEAAAASEAVRPADASRPDAPARVRIDHHRGFPGSSLAPFLREERARIAEFLRAARAPGDLPATELGRMLADIDYSWTHFPDEPDTGGPDKGFLARARVAALYYDERLRRLEASPWGSGAP